MEGSGPSVSPAQRAEFEEEGLVVLRGLLTPGELAEVAEVYGRFLAREVPVTGRDFCDMAGDYERRAEDFDVVNVMLPRRYLPAWRDNVYERKAAAAARALVDEDLVLDYDQLVAKPPGKAAAVFHWHQDLAYWPETPDTRTVTAWLALDRCDEENGCLRFVPGSHREPALRAHRPLHGDRDRSHTLVAEVDEARDRIVAPALEPGDAVLFCERVVHGSAGNTSPRWRRGYVVAFRTRATVEAERAMGFTHSHEDDLGVIRRIVRE